MTDQGKGPKPRTTTLNYIQLNVFIYSKTLSEPQCFCAREFLIKQLSSQASQTIATKLQFIRIKTDEEPRDGDVMYDEIKVQIQCS